MEFSFLKNSIDHKMKTQSRVTSLCLISFLAIRVVFADGYEKPKYYKFLYQNGDSIILNNSNDSLLIIISNEVINGQMKLNEAYLTFESGEKIIFDYDRNQLISMEMVDSKNEASVPKEVIDKIPEIHFQSITLFWIGSVTKAFDAGYFNIQFDIGKVKYYNVYPYLEIVFASKKYARTVIWKQSSAHEKQWSDF
jgi:hypothetical protein